jgi:hypothetical protein
MTVEEKQAVHNLLAKARAGRKQKYVGVPREMVCIKCGKKLAIQPGTLVKKVEKIAQTKGITYTIEDFLKTWECQSCKPSKGRKSTGKCKPVILKCKCGNEITYPANILLKRAEKKGITVEKLIASFVCQTCSPGKKRGRPRKNLTSTE